VNGRSDGSRDDDSENGSGEELHGKQGLSEEGQQTKSRCKENGLACKLPIRYSIRNGTLCQGEESGEDTMPTGEVDVATLVHARASMKRPEQAEDTQGAPDGCESILRCADDVCDV
jgi:hypothetical protein